MLNNSSQRKRVVVLFSMYYTLIRCDCQFPELDKQMISVRTMHDVDVLRVLHKQMRRSVLMVPQGVFFEENKKIAKELWTKNIGMIKICILSMR